MDSPFWVAGWMLLLLSQNLFPSHNIYRRYRSWYNLCLITALSSVYVLYSYTMYFFIYIFFSRQISTIHLEDKRNKILNDRWLCLWVFYSTFICILTWSFIYLMDFILCMHTRTFFTQAYTNLLVSTAIKCSFAQISVLLPMFLQFGQATHQWQQINSYTIAQ